MRKDALGHVPQGAQRHLIFSYKAKAKQLADSSMTSLPEEGVVTVKCLMCELHETIDQKNGTMFTRWLRACKQVLAAHDGTP